MDDGPGPSTSGLMRGVVLNKDVARNFQKPLRCCAHGCGNAERDHPGKVFYAFPDNTLRRAQWLQQVQCPDLQPSAADRVCSDDFGPHHYNAKGALRADAVPSLDSPRCGMGKVSTGINAKRIRKPTKEKEPQICSKQARLFQTEPESEIIIHIKEESDTEDIIDDIADTNYEESIQEDPNAEEECLHIETPCLLVDKDPLAIVKSEFVERTADAATQTFSRKELYLSVACTTHAEQIDLPHYGNHSNQPKITKVAQTQTTATLLAHFIDPIKRKIQADIRNTKRKTKILSDAALDKTRFMQCCDTYLDEKIANIVKSHSNIQDKYVGNRYGHEFKAIAQNLCITNPESYRFVERIFNLPSKKTLQRLQVPARTGANPTLIEYLKLKVSEMTEKEKLCAICFDVIRISKNLWYDVTNDLLCGMQEIDQVLGPEPAEYAAVLMIRGLYTKWTQPVSFSFMTEKRRYPELKEWLHKIIAIMFDIGLNIKVLSADLENDFLDLSLPDGESYFEIDGKRIYHFYDVRYLFKSARDALIKYKFHNGNEVAQWSHIIKVYNKDKEHEFSLMSKVTEAHVRPSGDAIDDVNLAIEIFSSTVAAAMNFHVISNMAKQKTRDTIEFINKMSKIYDILACKSLASAYKGTEQQNKVLSEALEYLQDLKVKDKSGNVIKAEFVTGLKVNIKAAMALIEELKNEDQRFLFTKVLSKDCAEAYFDEIRRRGGCCCERPTSIMFVRSFRRLFFENLANKDGDNEQDLKSTLYKVSEYIKVDMENNQAPEFDKIKRILGSGVSDLKIQWPSTEYIAGFLIWKCLEKHPCEEFIEKLSKHYHIEAKKETLLENFRKFNADNAHSQSIDLLEPPGFLVDFVDTMEQKFWEYYSKPDREPTSFVWNTYRYMEEDTFEMPCECFPLQFMKLWFIRIKIEQCVREHNKYNKKPRKPRHLQKKIGPRKNK